MTYLASTDTDVHSEAHQLERLTAAIEQRVGRQRFAVWFQKSTRLILEQDGLEIVVANDFISDWIAKRFTRQVQEAACEVLGRSLPIKFTLNARLFEEEPATPEQPRQQRPGDSRVLSAGSAPVMSRAGGAARPMDGSVPLTSAQPVGYSGSLPLAGARARLRHELSTFLVGPSNQVAYECAQSVARQPGERFNPLFIHGAVGLGKTHLLQGICRLFASTHPTLRFAYLTGEEFTNEFLGALRSNRVDSFRRKVRDLDLFLIDDVHFLSGKRATQEEFLHTFNAVEALGKQVVMASDNHPKMIASFGESLINRFVSGMVVRIDPPNRQMRLELLEVLAKRQGVKLTPDTMEWIATRVTQNVRELEGAITRMAAHVRLAGRVADVRLAQEVLGDLDRHLAQPVRPEQIFEAVCDFFTLEKRELMSGRRQRTISLARSVAMYLVRKTTSLSYPEIAGRMGKRNHSTVISACRRIEAAVQRDEHLQWTTSIGEREEDASELVQRLEDLARAKA